KDVVQVPVGRVKVSAAEADQVYLPVRSADVVRHYCVGRPARVGEAGRCDAGCDRACASAGRGSAAVTVLVADVQLGRVRVVRDYERVLVGFGRGGRSDDDLRLPVDRACGGDECAIAEHQVLVTFNLLKRLVVPGVEDM